MTMLEKAARAVMDAVDKATSPDTFDVEIARAVLTAVRDIDPAIHDKVTIGGWLDDEMKFSEAWHGGIDAILNDGEGE